MSNQEYFERPYNHLSRWLFDTTLHGEYPDGGFLLIPCRTELDANRIRSAIIQGAETIYFDDFASEVFSAYMSVFNSCEMIAQCLLNNPAFMDAVRNQTLQDLDNTGGNNNSLSTTNITSLSDDLDKIWGGCLEASEYVFEQARVILEYLDGFADAGTALNAISPTKFLPIDVSSPQLPSGGTDIVPYGAIVDGKIKRPDIDLRRLGKTNPTAVLGMFNVFLQAGISLLRSQLIQETNIEKVAAELFNLLTCPMIGQQGRQVDRPLDNGIILLWANAVSGLWEDLFWALPIAYIIAMEAVADEFLSFLNLFDLHRQYRIGLLQPSSTWQIIVGDCEDFGDQWMHEFEFAISDHNWTKISTDTVIRGTYVPTTGWRVANANVGGATNNHRRLMRIARTFSEATVTKIELYMDYTKGNFRVSNNTAQRIFVNGQTVTTLFANQVDNDSDYLAWEGEINAIEIGVDITTSVQNSATYTGDAYLLKVVVYGVGYNPFI